MLKEIAVDSNTKEVLKAFAVKRCREKREELNSYGEDYNSLTDKDIETIASKFADNFSVIDTIDEMLDVHVDLYNSSINC